jgi:hypothetical protein
MKKSFRSKAIKAVLTAIIRTIAGWAQEWGDDAFFFIVIGDKTYTDVAWSNPNQLACDGALALTCEPDVAAAFSDLSSSVELLLNDQLKENEFKEKFEKLSTDDYYGCWYSVQNTSEEGGES